MSEIFTIGHSNQPADDFIGLLQKTNVECVVDVRSKPYSRFRHFNREPLARRLERIGISYLYLGHELGGHPEREELYVSGRVAYERVIALPEFRRGINRVIDEIEQHRIVLMCTEENPAQCHRHPLLARTLVEHGITVLHIRRDGSVQNAVEVDGQIDPQLALLEPPGEDLTWRSPKVIRPPKST